MLWMPPYNSAPVVRKLINQNLHRWPTYEKNFTDDMSPVKPFKTFVEVNAIDIIVVAFCGYQLMFSWWETDLCESGAGWVSLIECTG